jgi:hypothetical protein
LVVEHPRDVGDCGDMICVVEAVMPEAAMTIAHLQKEGIHKVSHRAREGGEKTCVIYSL